MDCRTNGSLVRLIRRKSLRQNNFAIKQPQYVPGDDRARFSGWRSNPSRAAFRMAKPDRHEGVRFQIRIGENTNPMLGEVQSGADREASPVPAAREMSDDPAVVDRQRDGPGVCHQDH